MHLKGKTLALFSLTSFPLIDGSQLPGGKGEVGHCRGGEHFSGLVIVLELLLCHSPTRIYNCFSTWVVFAHFRLSEILFSALLRMSWLMSTKATFCCACAATFLGFITLDLGFQVKTWAMPVPMRPPPITTTSFTALVAMPLRMILVWSRSYFAGSPGDDVGQHCWKSSGKSKVP